MPRVCNFSKFRKFNASKKKAQEESPATPSGPKQLTLSKFFSKNVNEVSFDRLVKKEDVKKNGSTSNGFCTSQEASTTELEKPQEIHHKSFVSTGTLSKLRGFSSTFSEENLTDLNSPQKPNLNTDIKPCKRTWTEDKKVTNTADAYKDDCEDNEINDDAGISPPSRKRSKGKVGSTNSIKYTPLELQVLEIKKDHPDCLLLVECGYKYRFFGEDAETAAKELNIIAHLDHNFMTASIPTHRLFVHVRRLVAKGYKVGVVKQTETAALKAASDNRNTPFSRELKAVYTKSTIIGEDVDPVYRSNDGSLDASMESNVSSFLVCFYENTRKKQKPGHTTFGFIAIQPSSGDMLYDEFEDSAIRQGLETRMAHVQPVEMLIPKTSFSAATEDLIKYVSKSSSSPDDCIRIERLDDSHFEYSLALCVVTKFYEEHLKDEAVRQEFMNRLLSLSTEVISCLAALIVYLKDFKLERILVTLSHRMTRFSCDSNYVNLNAVTLRNLEIFQNSTNGKCEGSLFSVLNRTETKFGSRLMKKWLSHPLRDLKEIEERQEIVSEIIKSTSSVLPTLKTLLFKVPDLEKGLGTVFHLKCGTFVFCSLVKSLSSICRSLQSLRELITSEVESLGFRNLLLDLITHLDGIDEFETNINESAAKEGDKTKLFIDPSEFPKVLATKDNISEVLLTLKELKPKIRQTLRLPGFDYVTVSGQEFLIEVRTGQVNAVPKNWTKISSTKQLHRFRSPEVEKLVEKLNQLREQLQIDCNLAFVEYLQKFNTNFHGYSKAIQNLAKLDCLFSLAKVAQQDGYCKPFFVQHSTIIQIEGGRHPVVQTLLANVGQYVANNTDLDSEGKSCMIITGPNMGGKSSYIRQVALIVIMAQMGSYVPADAASLGIFDGIYTRMGASDEMYQGQSTFMVELQETSEIMKRATDKSLVILDELGRGTSTHDGVAIAYASLNYFVSEVKCLTTFVTHYAGLTELEKAYPGKVVNYHMGFLVQESDDDSSGLPEVVTFLYQLTEGIAARSYGLNVARLADIPKDIVQTAALKSREMEEEMIKRKSIQEDFRKIWSAKNIADLPNQCKRTL